VITSVIDRKKEFIECLISLKKLDIREGDSIEHIVHDATLSDSRKNEIEIFSKWHTIYHQSSDEGIYHGFNIGLKLSHGNYICFLNSDDKYNRNFISKSLETIEKSNCEWSFGDTVLIGENKSIFMEGKWDYFLRPYLNFTRFHHTSVMTKKATFNIVGAFPEYIKKRKIEFCGDYAWFLKAQKMGFYGVHNSEIVGQMSLGGATSGSGLKIYLEAMRIAGAVWNKNRISIRVVWILRAAFNGKLLQSLFRRHDTFFYFTRRVYSRMFRVFN
jgi:GT2 family glycosyltransferase